MTPRKTPLYHKHVEAGAKMTDFHGWLLPLQFTSIMEECKIVRKSAGLFDISHMGKAEARGAHALSLLQALTLNDVSILKEGQAQYNALVNEQGGIIDDMVVYCVGRNRYFLCLNAANVDKDISWLAEFALQYPDAQVRNLTGQYALLALQGPSSEALIKSLGLPRVAGLDYFNFMTCSLAGKNVILSRTGYTGEDGFEIYCGWNDAEALWDAILTKGRQWGVRPVGLGARDLLRLEMGYLLHGVDVDAAVTPWEAGLGWIVKLDKAGDMVAREALAARKSAGITKRIAGFTVEERGGVPRNGYPILADGRIIGAVTSGGVSPSTGKTIGMGYVHPDYAKTGTAIQIDIRGKAVAAQVAARPFVPSRTKKKAPEPGEAKPAATQPQT